MKKGFVFGKFLPLHKGHLALFDFAIKNCDKLYVIICFTGKESIDHIIRKQWLYQSLNIYPSAELVSFGYDENELPNTSVSSKEVSKKWAAAFKKILPDIDIVFTSEKYGTYLAEYMHIEHLPFDEPRLMVPISGTAIREKPLSNWEYIPEQVRPYFLKKICIVGAESTGKTTLTKRLGENYRTAYVPEMAREIIEETDKCTHDDLLKIAALHAQQIVSKTIVSNKFLFVDTNLAITKSYSQFLFNKDLLVEPWIEEANQFHLHIFLEPDCDYVQDGTRLSIIERNKLSDHHKQFFQRSSIPFFPVGGNWENRFAESCKIIDSTFGFLF